MKLTRIFTAYLTASCLASVATAANIYKANNADNLNLATSWTNSVVPGVSDVAVWDGTVSDPNLTTNTLGANLSWSGVKIISPAANLYIKAGNTLTVGASGIDMTAANVDLALSNAVTIGAGALQPWNVAPGHTLSVLAIPTKPGQPSGNTGALQVGTTGTVRFGAAAATTIADNQGNPWVNYGPSDWAALDSSGNVIAVTYTSASTAMTAGVFNDIVGNIPGGAGSAIDIPGIRFNDSTYHNVSIANSGTARTFTCRGILMTPNCVGALIGGTAATSFIRPNRSSTGVNTAWNIIQNSTIGDLTISALLADASSSTPVHMVKSGPGNLIIANPTAGGQSGGIDINGGTLTAAGGATLGGGRVTINNTGRLVVNASNTTFVASVAVNSGGTNRINLNFANAQQFISTVIFNAGSNVCGFSYATGISPSTTTAALVVSNVTANGSTAVNIYCGSPALGQFPLIKYTNSLTGAGFAAFNLGVMPLRTTGYLSNNVANTSIDLVITNIAEPLKWATVSGTWDIANTPNWKDALLATTTYQEANGFGDAVVFEDTLSGAGPITVTLYANPVPATVTVNAAKNYTISGSGGIAGTASLTKTGTGTLTLGTANTFNGGLFITNGIVNFSSVANLGNGGINFYGGTLQYAPGNVDDISVRGIYFGSGGGTIDDGGNTPYFANPIGNNGAGGFTKTGAGTLYLNGTNRYSGSTLVSNGTLALASTVTYISNSASITINAGAILDVTAKPQLTLNGALGQTLAGNGTVSGNVTCPTGATISSGIGGIGTLTMGDLAMSGGTNVFEISSTSTYDTISAGNLTFTSGTIRISALTTLPNGVYPLILYSGVIQSGPGSSGNLTLTGFSQAGQVATLSEGVGEIDLVIASGAADTIVWNGANGANWDSTGVQNWQLPNTTLWAYTNGDLVTFDEIGIAGGQTSVQLQATLLPGSITVSNATSAYTFADGTGTGGGKISGATKLTKKGPNTLIIQTANNNSGATDIQNGTVQVGNGGNGDLGTGNITNNGALVFAQGDGSSHLVVGQISGTGSVTGQGVSTSPVILAANNTYAGPTTISSGASLQVGNGGAPGSLGTGAVTNDGTLVYNKTGTFAVGNIKTGPANGGALTFLGAANVTLNNGSTYINNTTIDNGVVQLSAADSIPSGATVPGSTGWLVLDGGATSAGTLDINNLNITVNALSGTGGTFVGAITNTGASSTTTNIITVLGAAGTTYSGSILGNPNGSKIGLTLLGANELRLAGNCAYSGPTLVGSGATLGVAPGYVTGPGLTVLSNNASFYLDANSPSVFAGNAIFIPDNSAGTIYSRNAANGFSGTVTGGLTATNIIGANVSASSATVKQFQGMSGTVQVSATGGLRFSSTTLTVNGGDNATFEVDGTLNTRNGTATGAGISLGALTGTGTLSGGGSTPSTTSLYVLGAKAANATFAGTISDGGVGNVSIVKTGAGRQTLTGTASYTGNTTVNGGVLAITDPVSFDTSPTITLSAGTLDVSGRADGTLNLGNAITQTLAGNGTINGSLFEASTTINNLTLGVMNVTNVATINGALNLQINRTNTANCSELSALSFVNAGSISLTVANVGPTSLAAGDTFQLFNQAFTGGFVVTNLPALPSPQLYWTNRIALNGTLAVASLVNTTPTNLTSVVSGNLLTLSWPTDHTGWRLQVQTNLISVGLRSNWVDVAGSTAVNTMNFTLDPANGSVFYRMVYP